jgi:hypothetical protein
MKAVFISLVFAASAFAQSGFTINTPSNVAQCRPLQLTWTGGQPPYFLTVTPGAQPNAQPLVNLGQVNGTSFTWTKVNIQANTQIDFNLLDNNGALAQTAPVTVNDSGDSSCLGQPASGSGGTAAPPATTGGAPTGGATTSAGATTGGTTTPAGSSPAGSSPTKPATSAGNSASATKSGAPSSSSTNAAPANVVQTSAAGIIGAALLALLA